jgi:hypothetical protein
MVDIPHTGRSSPRKYWQYGLHSRSDSRSSRTELLTQSEPLANCFAHAVSLANAAAPNAMSEPVEAQLSLVAKSYSNEG